MAQTIEIEKKKLKWLRVAENKYFPNLCHPYRGKWFDFLKRKIS
jgi:hypothetical protein